MRRKRAIVLALRILGVILLIFSGFDIIRCLLGMFVDNQSSIAYIGSFISSGFLLLVGIGMMIVAGIIKKKFIN